MLRSKRLLIVVDIAHKNEQNAAEKLKLSRENLTREEARLRDIEGYYQDYSTHFGAKKNNLRVEQLVANRDFLRQLSQTAEAQKIQIQRVTEQVDYAKNEWFACHLKKENLMAYLEKLKREEGALQDKLEQKMVDEWVTQSMARHD